jgi:tRNA threonylcarbamoyladenosine modification (KEOPS) complex  Pcc1 subunit
MSGRKSRNKGKVGEREAAKFLNKIFGNIYRRGVQYSGGADSPDIKSNTDTKIHFEIKRDETTAGKKLYSAICQAKNDSGEDEIPVVMTRRNHENWLIVIEAKDIVAFANEVLKLNE